MRDNPAVVLLGIVLALVLLLAAYQQGILSAIRSRDKQWEKCLREAPVGATCHVK